MNDAPKALAVTTEGNGRLAKCFSALKAKKQKGLVTFITAGDPDLATSKTILSGLKAAGADIIELGMPFSDPMADGPAIEAAGLRALKNGMNLLKVLELAKDFRLRDKETPLVLMGYFNPIYHFGVDKFLKSAKEAGVDGLIIVDTPPEEDKEICLPALEMGIDFIRLVTPTTDAKRLPVVLRNAKGFLYYVSVTGITGSKKISASPVEKAILQLRAASSLPIAVGFGITTPEEAKEISQFSDAVIVGSAIVKRIAANLDERGHAKEGLAADVHAFVSQLAKATHTQ